jgi:hypothetical protein
MKTPSEVIPIKVNTKIQNILVVLHCNAFCLSPIEWGGYPAKGGG